MNINKASLEELLAISGIGESKAKAIIDYRKEKGASLRISSNIEKKGDITFDNI